MSWKFDHLMFSVLIGVFVKRMSNLFRHALLCYYYLYHICLINTIYFVLLILSLCFIHDHIEGIQSRPGYGMSVKVRSQRSFNQYDLQKHVKV